MYPFGNRFNLYKLFTFCINLNNKYTVENKQSYTFVDLDTCLAN